MHPNVNMCYAAINGQFVKTSQVQFLPKLAPITSLCSKDIQGKVLQLIFPIFRMDINVYSWSYPLESLD